MLRLDDRETLRALRRRLDAAGYTQSAIEGLLGVLPSNREADVAVHLRRLPGDAPLATLIKLFLLGIPVATAEARRALAPLPLDRLVAVGLIGPSRRGVRARVRLVPWQGLLLACDPLARNPVTLPADYVDGVTAPAAFLANLTVRRRVRSALDLGTGCGVQALLAARHARRVVATDVNPRALDYAAFNTRLNGLAHVECRRGSLFGPVRGERFDLIVANPPYVISPESRFIYRDSGQPGDAFCRRLVREAPRFLREGGWATIMVNWVCAPDREWWAPLRGWVAGAGFDAWLLHYGNYDPLTYAAVWNGALRSVDPAAYARALDRWCAHYRRLGIETIAAGAVLLRRRSAGPNWVRGDDFPTERPGPASAQLVRTAAVQDYLARLEDDRQLLDGRFRLVPNHRVERTPRSRRGVLHLDDALPFRAELDAPILDLLARCDGRRPLRALIAERHRGAIVPAVRKLVRLGFLARRRLRRRAGQARPLTNRRSAGPP